MAGHALLHQYSIALTRGLVSASRLTCAASSPKKVFRCSARLCVSLFRKRLDLRRFGGDSAAHRRASGSRLRCDSEEARLREQARTLELLVIRPSIWDNALSGDCGEAAESRSPWRTATDFIPRAAPPIRAPARRRSARADLRGPSPTRRGRCCALRHGARLIVGPAPAAACTRAASAGTTLRDLLRKGCASGARSSTTAPHRHRPAGPVLPANWRFGDLPPRPECAPHLSPSCARSCAHPADAPHRRLCPAYYLCKRRKKKTSGRTCAPANEYLPSFSRASPRPAQPALDDRTLVRARSAAATAAISSRP